MPVRPSPFAVPAAGWGDLTVTWGDPLWTWAGPIWVPALWGGPGLGWGDAVTEDDRYRMMEGA